MKEAFVLASEPGRKPGSEYEKEPDTGFRVELDLAGSFGRVLRLDVLFEHALLQRLP
jgi:hypothetical protein